MNYSTPYGWLKPRSAAQIALEQLERKADLKLIVNCCYDVILNCPDPAVRWQAAKLLQRIGPLEDH